MKILFVSYHNPNFLTITEYCEAALRSLGHEYVAFDDRQFFLPGRMRQRFLFLQGWDLRRLNNRLIEVAGRFQPDACVVAGGYRVLPATVAALKSRGIITALWTTDAPLNFEPIYATAPLYDLVCCGGTEAIEILTRLHLRRLFWLPFAADAERHRSFELSAAEQRRYASDIAFVGSYYENRRALLEQISDFNVGIWGPGWDARAVGCPLRKCVRSAQPVAMGEWLKIYAAATVVIAVHFQDGKTPCYQASPKVFEALACRKPLLVDNQSDIRRLFKDGKHLILFRDGLDLRDKARYLLDRPHKRQQIAIDGCEEVLANHSYVHRVKQLIRLIEEAQG